MKRNFLALCLFWSSVLGCQPPVDVACGQAYTVAVTYLPKKLDPRHNQINVYHFMILQLFEPLLTRSAGHMRSAFLDTERSGAMSKEFDAYRLCLKPDVRFVDGSPVTCNDLETSLRATHAVQEMLQPLAGVAISDGCLNVRLKEKDPDYLDKMTTAASTACSMR